MKSLKDTLLQLLGWEEYKARMKHRFSPDPVDAAQFGDPLAKLISWKPLPLDRKSLLYRRRMKGRPSSCLTFSLATRVKFVLFLAPLIPLVIIISFAAKSASHLQFFGVFVGIPTLVIGYFIVILVAYQASVCPFFDKGTGVYWKSRGKKPKQGESINLSDIHALQLLSFMYFGSGDMGRAGIVYQLNLVLKDQTRREVYTQRQPVFAKGRQAVINDARNLSRFLGVPLWDAIGRYDR